MINAVTVRLKELINFIVMDPGGFHNHEFHHNDGDGKKLTKKQAKYILIGVLCILLILIVLAI